MAKKIKEEAPAVALHAKHKDGVHHLVGLGNIRVVIIPDGSDFFAQGLEIDYAAQGKTVAEVRTHFEDGLCATIEQHLQMYGNIEGILQPAPAHVWRELLPDKVAMHNRYYHRSQHTIEDSELPFEGIDYFVAAAPKKAVATCE